MDSTEIGFFLFCFERRAGAIEITQHDFFKWGDVMLQTAGVALLAGLQVEKIFSGSAPALSLELRPLSVGLVSLMSRSARFVMFVFVFCECVCQDFCEASLIWSESQ